VTDSSFTFKGRATSRGQLGDVGVLLGTADQDFNSTVVLEVGETLKSISSRPAHRAVGEGGMGSKWQAVRYGRNKIQLRKLSS